MNSSTCWSSLVGPQARLDPQFEKRSVEGLGPPNCRSRSFWEAPSICRSGWPHMRPPIETGLRNTPKAVLIRKPQNRSQTKEEQQRQTEGAVTTVFHNMGVACHRFASHQSRIEQVLEGCSFNGCRLLTPAPTQRTFWRLPQRYSLQFVE
jgi:hypothetical protein